MDQNIPVTGDWNYLLRKYGFLNNYGTIRLSSYELTTLDPVISRSMCYLNCLYHDNNLLIELDSEIFNGLINLCFFYILIIIVWVD